MRCHSVAWIKRENDHRSNIVRHLLLDFVVLLHKVTWQLPSDPSDKVAAYRPWILYVGIWKCTNSIPRTVWKGKLTIRIHIWKVPKESTFLAIFKRMKFLFSTQKTVCLHFILAQSIGFTSTTFILSRKFIKKRRLTTGTMYPSS